MAGWHMLQGLGGILAASALAGLAGDWDDDAMRSISSALRQTNAYYDGMRIWISILILAGFLLWAGGYLNRHHGRGTPLPLVRAPVLFWACIAVTPVYLLEHHGGIAWDLFAEDGPMEYLTVALLAVSAALAAYVAYRGEFDRAERVLLWVFAGGLVFLAMEEISWGQRIFGIETPAALKESNVQGEINLHNLTVGWNEVVRMILACAISGILILLPRDAVPVLRGRLSALKPDGRFLPLIPILIASHIYDEWFEQIVSFAILAYAILIYRRSISIQSTPT